MIIRFIKTHKLGIQVTKSFNGWSIFTLSIYLVMLSVCVSDKLHAKEYIIGVEDVSYYPFYDFSAKQSNQKSFSKELLSTFFQQHGYKFQFVSLPVKRFDKWFAEESIDFKFPDNVRWRSAESKKLNISYSKPILHLTSGSYVLKKNRNLPEQAIKRLGTMYGFYPTLWVERVRNNSIEIVESKSTFSLVKHLLHGNLDAINIEKNVIDHVLKGMGREKDEIVLNLQAKHERYAFHFSTILHPEILQEFNEFLNTHSKQIAELKRKYGIIEALAN